MAASAATSAARTWRTAGHTSPSPSAAPTPTTRECPEPCTCACRARKMARTSRAAGIGCSPARHCGTTTRREADMAREVGPEVVIDQLGQQIGALSVQLAMRDATIAAAEKQIAELQEQAEQAPAKAPKA